VDARGRVDILALRISERVIQELEGFWGVPGLWEYSKPHMEEAIRDIGLRKVPEPLMEVLRKMLEAKREYDSTKT